MRNRLLVRVNFYQTLIIFSCEADESLPWSKPQERPMTETAKPKLRWGTANIECQTHEAEIRELQRSKWPLKTIWRHLQEKKAISVKYHSFRVAVLKFERKDTVKYATEEKRTETVPTLRSEPVAPQKIEETEGASPQEGPSQQQQGAVYVNPTIPKIKRF